MTLSEKITILRKRKGLSQAELAEMLGIAKRTLARWERGEAMPDIQKIVLLSEIFSVSTDSLLIDSIDPEKAEDAMQNKQRRHVSVKQAEEYLKAKFRAAYLIAAATFIMMLAPGIMLIIMALPFRSDILGTVLGLLSFFFLTTLSVSIYIYSHSKTARFDFIASEDFSLDYGATAMLSKTEERIMLSYAVRNTVAIVLCILSLAPLIIVALISKTSDLIIMISVTASLFIAGFGVAMFITSGIKRSALSALHDTKNSEKIYSKQLEDRIGKGFWILVIGFYLLYSFVSGNWHLSWLIFIFAAGISSFISAAFTLVRRANGNDSLDEK